jgi:transposase
LDDRRVISGIIHRLREGCRWRALPDEYGPYTTVFNRYNRWSKRGLWQRIFAPLVECSGPPLTMIDGSALKAHRSSIGARKGGAKPSHRPLAGGRTTKIHALVDGEGRPHAFLLTGGHVADITGAASLLAATEPSGQLIGDKGYGSDHLRIFLQGRGTTPVIPNKTNRKKLFPFDDTLYRLRNVIERTFCRLKGFRAIN